ncbi:MAG: type II toxin-antitoxin system RelE/ParE family toxin, partial [Lachnospiraceae bacterium]|nr:type II toxin-antitoxin system RelE/ParE family toxin [Lachnospiraceae bacterium]
LKRQGYRVFITEKNLVFYKIDDDKRILTIYAVTDQRQDYLSIIRGL